MNKFSKALNRWKEILLIGLFVHFILFIFSIFYADTNSFDSFINSWIRWDGPHYIDIAINGYQTNGENSLWIVFYPLYPLLIKLVSILIPSFNLASVITSIILTIIASIFLFELVLLDYSKREAILSVWFLNIFPTAYFLQTAGTESLFLATSLCSIYFFRKNNYIISGYIGLLASATRINGILLLPLMIIEALKKTKQSIITLYLVPFGFLTYLFINYYYFNDFFHFTKPLESNWFKKLDWPWVGIKNLVASTPQITESSFYIFFSEIFFLVLATVLALTVFFKIRKNYGIYMLVNLLLFTSTGFILSIPRYVLILFPIFISISLIKNKYIIAIISTVSIILLVYYTSLYVQGKWAF